MSQKSRHQTIVDLWTMHLVDALVSGVACLPLSSPNLRRRSLSVEDLELGQNGPHQMLCHCGRGEEERRSRRINDWLMNIIKTKWARVISWGGGINSTFCLPERTLSKKWDTAPNGSLPLGWEYLCFITKPKRTLTYPKILIICSSLFHPPNYTHTWRLE